MEIVNLTEKLGLFQDYWSPEIENERMVADAQWI